ncbi:MAG: hemolysin secretion protein D [Brevundimonas sp.]|uniref:HlyD family secretion protein n=1 Tax=Brevundimonas sp. TaxID=1871086 RepID=UPI000DB6AA5B|nr:HlyD family secretion protein [Brevundimonas sp.]PZU76905.1 MAG: hemolysin secretion protein D [Brevundimonas sp.]
MSPELKKRLPLVVAGLVGLVLIVGGVVWWLNGQRWESTDNAFVQADTTLVSPQLSGRVVEVLVGDNQRVEAGQILVRLDDSDQKAQLAQAEANLQAAVAAVGHVDAQADQEQATIAARAAAVSQAHAQAGLAQAEVDRYGKLAQQGWVSQQRIQTERATAATAAASVQQAQAALVAEQRTAGVLGSTRQQSVAAVEQARAVVDQARIALERTVIRAPVAGVVGARSVRAGQFVTPGAQLLSIVPLSHTYIVANFKETQLAKVRLGQTVEISADAFPGRKIEGRIDSFSPATGAEFALIPVENATGNFTKITQRVPVRIVLSGADRGLVLRPGLSVDVKVDLKSQGGQSFAEAVGTVAPASANNAGATPDATQGAARP